MHWLLIGSSDSALRTLAPFVDGLANYSLRSITCNAGIKIVPSPTIYVLCDASACKSFAADALAARSRGTRLVTLRREKSALIARGVDAFDEFLLPAADKPTRTTYAAYRFTGPLCLEYACHHGATTIHLIGCDGYSSDPEIYRRHTLGILQPSITAIAECWHDVEFVQYGEPCYDVHAPNWRVVRC